MTRILAIDLGKFNSVTCLLNTATNETEFWTMATDRPYLLAVLKKYDPDSVVIESCGLAGWVHDVCWEAVRHGSVGCVGRFPERVRAGCQTCTRDESAGNTAPLDLYHDQSFRSPLLKAADNSMG